MNTITITGAIIAFCVLVTIFRPLQRAVAAFLYAGLIVLALWTFVQMLREPAFHVQHVQPVNTYEVRK